MPELVIDSLDAVDEALRGAYVEKEGKFSLDPDKYAEVSPKTQGLKTKNRELLEKLTGEKAKTKRFEKLAELDDDELEKLFELHANPPANGNGNGKSDGDTEAVKAQLEKVHGKALAKITAEKTAAEQERDALRTENRH